MSALHHFLPIALLLALSATEQPFLALQVLSTVQPICSLGSIAVSPGSLLPNLATFDATTHTSSHDFY